MKVYTLTVLPKELTGYDEHLCASERALGEGKTIDEAVSACKRELLKRLAVRDDLANLEGVCFDLEMLP